MPFIQSINRAFEIVKLNSGAMMEVAADQKAMMDGIVIIIIAGILGGISKLSIMTVVGNPVGLLIGSVIGYGIIHLLALAFKGEGKFTEFYRVGAHSMILQWLSLLFVVPILGPIVSLVVGVWSLIVGVVIVVPFRF